MAHFAKIGLNNTVINIVVVHNDELKDADGNEVEALGVQFLTTLYGYPNWVQTSYNHQQRKHYAGKGYTYDQTRDAFIPPKTYPSWILDEDTCLWDAPTPMPDDDKMYNWDEDTTSWKEI